jgi:hypothetical protein
MNFLFCNLLGGCPGKIMKNEYMSVLKNTMPPKQRIIFRGPNKKPVLAGYQDGSLGSIPMVLKKQMNVL